MVWLYSGVVWCLDTQTLCQCGVVSGQVVIDVLVVQGRMETDTSKLVCAKMCWFVDRVGRLLHCFSVELTLNIQAKEKCWLSQTSCHCPAQLTSGK